MPEGVSHEVVGGVGADEVVDQPEELLEAGFAAAAAAAALRVAPRVVRAPVAPLLRARGRPQEQGGQSRRHGCGASAERAEMEAPLPTVQAVEVEDPELAELLQRLMDVPCVVKPKSEK